ncbi:MAG: hypothetical protein LUQ32_01055 [Methanomicrobiales archaeon]|nr:hypothetical protein [Methanomicrobiales archaeon]
MGEETSDKSLIGRPGRSAATILLLLLILPCLLGLLGGSPLVTVLGFITSILVLQGLAAAAGIGLGIPAFLLIPLMVSVAAGVVLGIYRICDLFSERSQRVAQQIGRVKELMDRHQTLRTYGEFMLILIMWIPGFGLYGTPVVAWILQWRGLRSILLILTGWLLACLFVLMMTAGIRMML